MMSSLTIYPITNYSFGTKPPKFEKDTSVIQRMERLKEKYAQEGVRKSVDAVLVVYEHGHPHVLLLQVGSAFFKLPGGRLRPGEGEVEGLLRKMTTILAPEAEHLKPEWRVGEVLGTYYRPNFENIMYPYCPAHIVRPKEIRRLYLVQLPEKCFLAVPKNYRLVAVPLFEIYDHMQRYGPVISAIPQLLSRFNIIKAQGATTAAAGAEGGAVPKEEPTAVENNTTLSLHPDQAAMVTEQPPAPSQDDGFVVDFD